jgi:hypothetical protein
LILKAAIPLCIRILCTMFLSSVIFFRGIFYSRLGRIKLWFQVFWTSWVLLLLMNFLRWTQVQFSLIFQFKMQQCHSKFFKWTLDFLL